MRFWRTVSRYVLFCFVVVTGAQPAMATTAVLIDVTSGKVLHAERADQRWYPASITKLMTAYIAFEVLRNNPRLNEHALVTLSEHANAQEPTKLWLKTGTRLKLKTAIGAMIVKSANDAAVMVAEGAGSELASFTRYGSCRPGGSPTAARYVTPAPDVLFRARASGLGAIRADDAMHAWSKCNFDAFVARMNVVARKLGMGATRFVNPNGLPDGRQVTTARDFALLASALIRDFPQYAPLFAARSMRYSGGRLRSYNSLLRTFEGADGMKTGFICAAGYNMVASATQNGRRLVAVVLGWSKASQRNARASALLAHGFRVQPTQFGPHDVTVGELDTSSGIMTPPPDIRASLRSRNCRRGPWGRLKLRPRHVSVRALDAPRDKTRVSQDNAKDASDTRPSAQKKKSTRKATLRPKPKRVSKRKKKRVSGKKPKSSKVGRTARSALRQTSQR